jgi:FkbM family methyltransferase
VSLAKLIRGVVAHPVNRRRPSRGLFDLLAWQIRSGLSEGPHVQAWVGGARFFARRGETGVTGNIYSGLHEFEDMAFALHVLGSGSLFVDIGANAGSYTLLAAKAAGSRVVAFEPVPSTYERLRANIALNGINGLVRAHNMAVGAQPGFVGFTVDEDSTNHAVPGGGEGGPGVQVAVLPLDDVLAGERPELVKVDVEGYELPVVRGGARSFSPDGANAVLLELNGSGMRYGWRDDEVAAVLFDAGYRTCRYFPFERRLECIGREVNREGNTLFIRDIERACARVAQAPAFSVKGLRI